MHRRPPVEPDKQRSPLPPVATGIALGLWVALMLVVAFVIVPTLFALCALPGTTGGAAP